MDVGFVEVDDFAEYEVDDADNIDDLQTTGGNVTSNQAQLKALEERATEFQNQFEALGVNANASNTNKSLETTNNNNNLSRFKGTLKTGEKIRNINGVSYIVPAPVNNTPR